MTTHFPAEVASESVPCDRCATTGAQVLFEGPDRLHHLPGTFRLVQCPECGWIRQNPRPTAETIGYYYPSDYINFIGAVEDEPGRLRRWDRRYGILKRRWALEAFQPRGRLLDVGCATGVFLHEMAGAGWEVMGIEPNEEAAAYARGRFDLPVHVGTLQTARLPAGSFDVVTFWDVLEHLHTPWQDLVEAHRLLAVGGLLVIRIPNLGSMGARLFGPLWLGWDLPRHLYLFPTPALTRALSDLGFTLAARRCIATGHSAFMLSLQFCLEDSYSPSSLWANRIVRWGRSRVSRVALAPLFWVIGQARLSSVITVFATK